MARAARTQAKKEVKTPEKNAAVPRGRKAKLSEEYDNADKAPIPKKCSTAHGAVLTDSDDSGDSENGRTAACKLKRDIVGLVRQSLGVTENVACFLRRTGQLERQGQQLDRDLDGAAEAWRKRKDDRRGREGGKEKKR